MSLLNNLSLAASLTAFLFTFLSIARSMFKKFQDRDDGIFQIESVMMNLFLMFVSLFLIIHHIGNKW